MGGTSREAGRGSSLPEVARAPVGDWRHLPPLQRVVAEHPVTNPTARFSAGLAAWQDPTFLAPLRHAVGPGEPFGTVEVAPVRPAAPEPAEEALPVVEQGPVSRLVDRVVQRFGGTGDLAGGRSHPGRTPGSGTVAMAGSQSDMGLPRVPMTEPPTSGLRPTAGSGRAPGTRVGEATVQRSVGGSHDGSPTGDTSLARRADGDFAATDQGVAPHARLGRDDAGHLGHPHAESSHDTATAGAASSVQRDLADVPLLGVAASPASARDGADLAADPGGTPGSGDLGTGHTGTVHPDPTSSHGHGSPIQRGLSLAPGDGPTTGPGGGSTDGSADEAIPGAADGSGLGVGTTFDLYPGSTATSGEMASESTGLISGDLSSGTFTTGPAPGTDRTGSAGPSLQRSTSTDSSSDSQTSSDQSAARSVGDGPRRRRLGLGAPLAPGELPTALQRQTNPDQGGTGHHDRPAQRTTGLLGDPTEARTGPSGSTGDSATSDTSPSSSPTQGTSGLLSSPWDSAQSNSPWESAQSGGAEGSADLSATSGFNDLSDAGTSAVLPGETGDSTGLLGTHRLGDSGDTTGVLGETLGSANALGGTGTAGLAGGTQGSQSGGSAPGGGPSSAPTVGGVVQRLADDSGRGRPSHGGLGDLSARSAPATSPNWSDTTGDLPLGSESPSTGDARSEAVRVLALPTPAPGSSTGLLGHQSLPLALQRTRHPSGPGMTAPFHPGAASPHAGTAHPSHAGTTSPSYGGTQSPVRPEVTARTYPATAALPGTRPAPPDPDPPAHVQRLPEPDPPPMAPSLVRTEEAFVQRAEAAPAPAPATGDGAPQEELLKKLFDPLLRRLKAELRLDRDRRGALTDLRH